MKHFRFLLLLGLVGCSSAYASPTDDQIDHSVAPAIQIYAGGPGIYVWNKYAGATKIWVALFCPGSGGGSGGAVASDSGGGGGAAGSVFTSEFLASNLGATESIVLSAGGVGGVGVTSGDGNAGTPPVAETSFGSQARNLMRCRPGVAAAGSGGTATAGAGGVGTTSSYTVIKNSGSAITGASGGAGDDDATASNGGNTTMTQINFNFCGASSGGGGGGIHAGANFTAGGISGSCQNSGLQFYITQTLGGTSDGQAGAAGITYAVNEDGGFGGFVNLRGGYGGGGGAGSILTNGGRGGDGGNCAGSGGGGGASLNGTSGAGGNGGAGCVFIYQE